MPMPPTSNPLEKMVALASQTGITQAICLAALEGWRLTRLVPRLCEEDGMRVQAIADRLNATLAQAGIVIQDHTDQPYIEGLSIEIVTTEDRADLPAEVMHIVETIKPSIYIGGQLAVQGQVIVGRGLAKEIRGTDGPLND